MKMKRGLLLFVLCLIANFSEAQLTERLQAELLDKPSGLYPVSISFVSSRSLEQIIMSSSFENKTFTEKQRFLNQHLIEERDKSQKAVLYFLENQKTEISYRSFYIVNRIVAQLSKSAILSISGMAHVNVLDLASGDLEFDKPIESQDQNNSKTTGATAEPGLVAINSPSMWELGYTGRGKKVYVYDTGVWSEHPAFSNRFMGRHVPLDQAWYGLFSDEPNGNWGSHGTHVLGTVAGLDTLTNDTIGSAFGSYWMACDLINSGFAADLPPQAELIAAFEWALNPDGDTSTTDDIPDVINNSWRWLDNTDTTECYGFIPQLMNTIEAAGIANVFSGGNTGPNNNGVRSPQRINTTDVNTFTVGSVNANLPWPHPISSFSTRGPTQCPGSGSLSLFPEVVAPGQNVRSAWGKNGYNSISGTSMASPHVSGALLLLKEAFPNLAGNVLLQALYTTAIDMGTVGEDNIYGRGLIDVYAAFQYLSLTHTPHDPNAASNDVAIDYINEDFQSYQCGTSYEPKLRLINLGGLPIDSVELSIFKDGVLITTTNEATPQLLGKGDTVSIQSGLSIPLTNGKQELTFRVKMNNQEVDDVNNSRMVRTEKLYERLLPFLDAFESNLALEQWSAINPDRWITWGLDSVKGWAGNSWAYAIKLGNYTPLASQKDGLRSPVIDLNTTKNKLSIGFDVAYQIRGGSALLIDSLNVYVSEDCGLTFTKVYAKSGQGFKSVNTIGPDFVPSSKQDWKREQVDISAYKGKQVVIKLESVNRKGNTIYIDNFSVYDGQVDPLSIDEEKLNVSISPNPVNEILNVNLESSSKYNYEIFDVTGRLISDGSFEDKAMNLNVSQYQSGVYYLSVFNGSGSRVVKFVKQ